MLSSWNVPGNTALPVFPQLALSWGKVPDTASQELGSEDWPQCDGFLLGTGCKVNSELSVKQSVKARMITGVPKMPDEHFLILLLLTISNKNEGP